MSGPEWEDKVIPAQLAFLSIYNPSLGPTDETFPDQIVFHYSRAAKEAKSHGKGKTEDATARQNRVQEEENEKLRQIGLAQAMVGFARYNCLLAHMCERPLNEI